MTNTKHRPDPAALYVVGFSGGKDSVATWLHLTRELELPNVICVFADTGHEAPELHLYLDYLEEECQCPLYRIAGSMQQLAKSQSHEPISMKTLAIYKKMFPSPTARFCTTELKLKPFRSFIDDIIGRPYEYCQYFIEDDKTPPIWAGRVINVSGVRADESPKRREMAEFVQDDFMGVERWIPIKDWTALDTFGCHDRHGVRHNPLYRKGCPRVGCFPCILANKSALATMARHTDALQRTADLESEVGHSFFAPGKVPARYRTQTDPKSGKKYPSAEDVARWALSDDPNPDQQTLGLDDDLTAPTCLSVYGLCE